MAIPSERITRLAGLLVGVTLGAVAVASWRVPGGTGELGADMRLVSLPTGELDVSPAGLFLSAVDMHPGAEAARGEVSVRNQTGSMLNVRLRALPSSPDLDDLVVVRIDNDQDRIFEGSLGRLRSMTEDALRVAAGERRILRSEVWLPRDVRGGYEGRIVDVAVVMEVEVIRP